MPTIHLLVKGKVQGVFFRASAKEKAVHLGISGWVRNTGEGHVEVLATGNEEQLAAFIDWCRKGPDKARVTDVDITEKPLEMIIGFRIIR